MKLINISLNSGINDSLINRIADGDRRAFDELYEKTKKIVYSIAISITKSPSDSDDITQETYIKIIEKAKDYQGNQKPLAWIYTITRNAAISSIRKNKKIEEIATFEDDVRLSVEENTIDAQILKSALSILPEEELQIVLLHNSGLKHKEIAKLFNKPLSTILSKYNRSLSKMRNFLQKN